MDQTNLITGNMVRDRFGGISQVTLNRWINNDPSFPKPLKINGRNFWRDADLKRWEESHPVHKAARAA